MTDSRYTERTILTESMIERGATVGGAYYRPQLFLVGVSWPPRHGWKKRLAGTEISVLKYELYLRLSGVSVSRGKIKKFRMELPKMILDPDFADKWIGKHGKGGK